ncbi:recombinase family protein [Bradyrhizobium sp. USDA 4463]
MKIGYARVSSSTQDHAAQIEALKAAGCERVFSEKVSGADSARCRPPFRNDLAHRSDLISPAIPR